MESVKNSRIREEYRIKCNINGITGTLERKKFYNQGKEEIKYYINNTEVPAKWIPGLEELSRNLDIKSRKVEITGVMYKP